ncbi:MAG: ATP-dependent RecD-like DNA helicase [Candidatus Bipolaricaulota bacterium]
MERKKELTEVEVNLERIVYKDQENGFTVARADPLDMIEETITIVGNLPSVFPGQKLNLRGYWDFHPDYGRQFRAEKAKIELPATQTGIQKYLASDFIKGIGPVIAERITESFGKESLNVIDQQPEKLTEIEGIGPHRLQRIKEGWQEGKEIRNIMIFLQEHGVSTSYSVRIYKEYGEDTVKVLKDDPYRMVRDVFGIGFKTADRIAKKLGLDKSDPSRLEAGIEYSLQQATNEGHLFLPRRDLLDDAACLLESSPEELRPSLDKLIEEERLIEECDLGEERPTYLAPLYFGEVGVANRIAELSEREPLVDESRIGPVVKKFASSRSLGYNSNQFEALEKSLTEKVLLIVGGPGTGKTTVLKGIIALMENRGEEVRLAAPTGRAAKRLNEATGREAKTIHRLLKFRPPNNFEHGDENKLPADAVIIDEMSMVDLLLANNLLKAVPNDATLILVGDKDQLPAVGPGNVLQDLLDSSLVARVELTEIFRQARESKIVTNAHRINRGEFPNLQNRLEEDFFFIEEEDPKTVADKVANLAAERLPRNYSVDPFKDVQVLSPMHRGPAGVESLNRKLQERLNPHDPLDLPLTDRDFRLKDKVMQIRNNYQKEVFNGDIGRIVDFNEEHKELSVEFPDAGLVNYDAGDLAELVLAYAVTIHKSQGSEYPLVIIPLLTRHYVMLQRNLLYTAVTRAKRLVVIVGSKKAMGIAVSEDKSQNRFSLLAERLDERGKE